MASVMIIGVLTLIIFCLVSGATAVATSSIQAPPVEPEDHGAPISNQYPPLSAIQGTLITSAEKAFSGDEGAFISSVDWHAQTKLASDGRRHHPAAYLACTPPESPDGLVALQRLQELSSSESTVRVVSSSEEYGVCFFVTATPEQAEHIRSSSPLFRNGGSGTWMPYPSTLKLAPGLLDHEGAFAGGSRDGKDRNGGGSGGDDKGERRTGEGKASDGSPSLRLTTTHGKSLKFPRDDGGFSSTINGLTIQLAPGVLPATNRRRREAETRAAGMAAWFENGDQILEEWLEELMAESLNLYESNFWSSESGAVAANSLEEGRAASRGDTLLAREWSRAAEVLHDLGGGFGAEAGPTVGSACSWHNIYVFHTDDDLLTLRGIEHLLPGGRGAGGTEGEEADELQVACFMGLLSYLAARPEVLQVAAERKYKTHNAAAIANVQSANLTRTPLTDSGLDGSGEVIQVVDTGLDYNSCFFIDNDSVEVDHGHYFEELGVDADALSVWYPSSYNLRVAQIFIGGNFNYDLSRRKIVQYIDLIRQDHSNISRSQPYGVSWASTFGKEYKWLSPAEFSEDYAAGHGTHTAGSAAGSTISNPATTETCDDGREVSCVGGCIDADDVDGDDLVPDDSFYYWYYQPPDVDLDRLCPRYGCDSFGVDSAYCLDDDEATTLANHGGVARGAKLAIFDVLDDYTGIGVVMAGRGIWDPAIEAGSKIHSNSWGSSSFCEYDSFDVIADDFMYSNPENLLIVSAGNDGDYSYYGYSCTVGGPGIAKNVLTIGASTSGPGRLSATASDGGDANGYDRAEDIDVVAYFSSYGPALDGRIKPDVVAPGDMVYSAAGSGTDNYTCRLWDYSGTSMSAPIVAGSAALVRQYFKNETFYAHDVETRGYCDSFGCEAFSPSAATVKAMLINSANLMGGSAEPDGTRGFGRVHLEPGMPLSGEGDRALFVVDSAETSTPELTLTEYSFQVNGSAGLELRATLAWIDPPTSALALRQLVHDLDLAVYSPDGTRFSMWDSGEVDATNNVERVIVPAETVAEVGTDPGTWGVRVWSKRLAANETQAYALVVTGAISPPEENDGTVARVRVTSTMTSLVSSSTDS